MNAAPPAPQPPPKLLTPAEADRLLRYPRGRSARLARRGLLPCVELPDGELRFPADLLERLGRERFPSSPVPRLRLVPAFDPLPAQRADSAAVGDGPSRRGTHPGSAATVARQRPPARIAKGGGDAE